MTDAVVGDSSESIDRKWNALLVDTILACTQELRASLPITEDAYVAAFFTAHSDHRAYYLYGVLDEVTRAATHMVRTESLLEPPTGGATTPLERATIGAILSEQALWSRKLKEALTNLIGFTECNESQYYFDLMLREHIDARERAIRNMKIYFDSVSTNAADDRTWLVDLRDANDALLDPKLCWYRSGEREGRSKNTKLLKFGERLRHVLRGRAYPNEVAVLGPTYGAYSQDSTAIHFGATDPHDRRPLNAIAEEFRALAFLAAYTLLRICELAGMDPNAGLPATRRLALLFGSSVHNDEQLQRLTKVPAEDGDYVAVFGALARVTAHKFSAFGYAVCQVRFLRDEPLPGAETDWVPGFLLQFFMSAQEVTSTLESQPLHDERSKAAHDPESRRDSAAIAAWRSIQKVLRKQPA